MPPQILLRDTLTKEWITQDNRFSKHRGAAAQISSVAAAFRVTSEHKKRRLELVVYVPERQEEIAMPVNDPA